MGYGGDLIMTASVAAYRAHTGRRVALVKRPGLSDLLRLRLYKPSPDAGASPIFAGNPDIVPVAAPAGRRWGFVERVDAAFWRVLARLALEPWLDGFLQRLCCWRSAKTGERYLYQDAIRFSYAAKTLPDRIVWKDAPNVVAAVLQGFLDSERPVIVHPQPAGAFHGLETEAEQVDAMLARQALSTNDFIVVEPSTNLAWFGDLRAWPMENWQALIDRLQSAFPKLGIVQIGVDQGAPLGGVSDWRGKTTFRQAAALIQRSKLFIGTEGGLMHAARAVDARALIIWGGVTLPTFAGHPDCHIILANEVSCAPCGLCGNCPFDKACIRGIDPDFAFAAVAQALAHYKPGLRLITAFPEPEERSAC